MPASVTFSVHPSPLSIGKAIKSLGRDLRTWRPAFKAVLPYVAQGVRENLLSRGGKLGAPWPRLASSTLLRKARLGQDRGPLIGTGDSILSQLALGKATVKITSTRLKYGIPGKTPSVQQFGRKKGDLPARRYMAWNPEMERVLHVAMRRHAEKLIKLAHERILGVSGGASAPAQSAPAARGRDARGRFTRGGA